MSTPADIANQALDAIGSEASIGDLTEGTREAQVLLRAYGQSIRQLLRSANWDFARKEAPLSLLGDATGRTATAGPLVPEPWVYEYAYPIDCVKARFVPFRFLNGTPSNNLLPIQLFPPLGTPSATQTSTQFDSAEFATSNDLASPTVPPLTGPLMTNLSPVAQRRQRPARFLIATDSNYPEAQGQDIAAVQGVSTQGRTVVLTNVPGASLVYTSLVLDPNLWDSLFRAAVVAYLASEVVMAVMKDKKFAMAMRKDQIAIAKQRLMEARAVDGNEGMTSSDIRVDWMSARTRGGYEREWSGDACGTFWGANDACGFADGTSY